MAKATVSKVTVYKNEIDRAFLPGGTVYQNMRRIGAFNEAVAKKIAPKRTGAMAEQINLAIMPHRRYEFMYAVRSPASYSEYVLGGTDGPIYANNGGLLWIRPKPYSNFNWRRRYASMKGRTPMFWVHGQTANNFLGRSLDFTMQKVNSS